MTTCARTRSKTPRGWQSHCEVARPAALVFRSDRGTLYVSGQFTQVAAKIGITGSMGSTGVCWDCETVDCLQAALKTEFCYRRDWAAKAKATLGVGAWIEIATTADAGTPQLGRLAPSARTAQLQRKRGKSTSRITPCPPTGVKSSGA